MHFSYCRFFIVTLIINRHYEISPKKGPSLSSCVAFALQIVIQLKLDLSSSHKLTDLEAPSNLRYLRLPDNMLAVGNGNGRILTEPKPKFHNELDNSMIRKLTELEAPSNLHCLKHPDNMLAVGNGNGRILTEPKPKFHNELDNSMIWKLTELEAPSNLRCLKHPDNMLAVENGNGRILTEPKPKIHNELDSSMIWKLTELEAPSNLRCLRLPDNMLAVGICKLVYTNSGRAILALASNAVHKLWKWPNTDMKDQGKATTDILPQLWQPASRMLMTNDISNTNLKETVPCFALSKNDSYVASASGGKVSLFNVLTSRTMTTFMAPPPAVTCLAFHREDNNILAIGMEDSSIQIYNVRIVEIQSKLEGHQKRVTGLAFSSDLKILVSSGADAQLCVWNVDGWEKQTSKFLQLPSGRNLSPLAQTRVQFHKKQAELLVVHETQLAIYEAPKLDCIKQWVPQDSSDSITDATYSCSSKSIYASFQDGSVRVFIAATLNQRCRICPTAYLPQSLSLEVYPVVVAAHPMEANQFSLGLSDGGVVVFEPLKEEGRWGTEPPLENGATLFGFQIPTKTIGGYKSHHVFSC